MHLVEKAVRRGDDVVLGVSLPDLVDAGVSARGLERALGAERIGVVVGRGRRRAELDHGRVSRALTRDRRAEVGGPGVLSVGPVSDPVERAPIAEHHGRLPLFQARAFELALDVIDRPLRRLAPDRIGMPGKAAAEDDARGLGEHHDVLAEMAAHQLEDGGLAGAWATGDDHEPRLVVCARAGTRDRGRGRWLHVISPASLHAAWRPRLR